jgi:DNA-binding HxlR family transcriptional regulator
MQMPDTEDAAAADVYSETCPSRHALGLVSNKWALLIVPALRRQPMRNNELLRKVGGISQKMLTQTLRELESGVSRRSAGVPPTSIGASRAVSVLPPWTSRFRTATWPS